MFGYWNDSRLRTFVVAALVLSLSVLVFSATLVACGGGFTIRVSNNTDLDVDFYIDHELQGEVEARETRSFGGVTEGVHLLQAKVGGVTVVSESAWVDSNTTFSVYYLY